MRYKVDPKLFKSRGADGRQRLIARLYDSHKKTKLTAYMYLSVAAMFGIIGPSRLYVQHDRTAWIMVAASILCLIATIYVTPLALLVPLSFILIEVVTIPLTVAKYNRSLLDDLNLQSVFV